MPCHWRKLLVKCLTWTWRLHALSLEKVAGQVFDMDLETTCPFTGESCWSSV